MNRQHCTNQAPNSQAQRVADGVQGQTEEEDPEALLNKKPNIIKGTLLSIRAHCCFQRNTLPGTSPLVTLIYLLTGLTQPGKNPKQPQENPRPPQKWSVPQQKTFFYHFFLRLFQAAAKSMSIYKPIQVVLILAAVFGTIMVAMYIFDYLKVQHLLLVSTKIFLFSGQNLERGSS